MVAKAIRAFEQRGIEVASGQANDRSNAVRAWALGRLSAAVGFFTREEGMLHAAPLQLNTDRTYPGRWTIAFSDPPINMFVRTTIV